MMIIVIFVSYKRICAVFGCNSYNVLEYERTAACALFFVILYSLYYIDIHNIRYYVYENVNINIIIRTLMYYMIWWTWADRVSFRFFYFCFSFFFVFMSRCYISISLACCMHIFCASVAIHHDYYHYYITIMIIAFSCVHKYIVYILYILFFSASHCFLTY